MTSRQWLEERAAPGGAGAPARPESRRAALALTRLAASMSLSAAPSLGPRGELDVELSDRDGPLLVLHVAPASERPTYRRNESLGVWFTARADRRRPAAADRWLDAAATLLLSDRLSGLAAELPSPAAPSAAPLSAPVRQGASNNPYKRLDVLGAPDVERFFHVDYDFDEGEHGIPATSRIGVIYQCNQPCTFCRLAEMNTHIPPSRVYEALDASRARGSTRVILTGGEPTMCKHLTDYVAYARDHGFTTIELQTNATLLDDRALASRLRDAGLTDAQVSLHGPDGAISDRLTGAPGTHARTLQGIDNLLAVGARVLLNHLVFRDNLHLLGEFVALVDARWREHASRLVLQFHSPLDEFTRPELARQHIARYTEVAGPLSAAIDRARELGYRVKDLQDPTGIPALCVLGASPRYLGELASQATHPRFHRWESGWLGRASACGRCDLSHACMGIPKAYLDLYGDEEFVAVHLPPGPADGST